MPAAIDGFKAFKIFSIFSGDIPENSEFKILNLILSQQDATLDSVNTFGEEGSLNTNFSARVEENLLKMEQFLYFKQMFDACAVLDGKPVDFKFFQKSIGLLFASGQVHRNFASFINQFLNVVPNFFVSFLIDMKF